MQLPLKDAPSTLVRDANSKAIINKNLAALEELKARREQQKRMIAVESKIEMLESKMDLILQLLTNKNG